MTYTVTKKPWLGGILVLILGPIGFLYYSWQKALVTLLLYFLPIYALLNVESIIASIVGILVLFFMAAFAYFDLKGDSDKASELFASAMAIVAIPIILLNLFGGLIGGIWLLILGEWRLVLVGFLLTVIFPFIFSLALMILLPIGLLSAYFAEKKLKFMFIISSFIYSLMNYVIILAYIIFVFSYTIYLSETKDLNIIPLMLYGYSVATSPFTFMASKEPQGPGSISSYMAVFMTQITYILLAVTYILQVQIIIFPLMLIILFTIILFLMSMTLSMYDDNDLSE